MSIPGADRVSVLSPPPPANAASNARLAQVPCAGKDGHRPDSNWCETFAPPVREPRGRMGHVSWVGHLLRRGPNPHPRRVPHRFRTAADAELSIDVGHVVAHRLRGDATRV